MINMARTFARCVELMWENEMEKYIIIETIKPLDEHTLEMDVIIKHPTQGIIKETVDIPSYFHFKKWLMEVMEDIEFAETFGDAKEAATSMYEEASAGCGE